MSAFFCTLRVKEEHKLHLKPKDGAIVETLIKSLDHWLQHQSGCSVQKSHLDCLLTDFNYSDYTIFIQKSMFSRTVSAE